VIATRGLRLPQHPGNRTLDDLRDADLGVDRDASGCDFAVVTVATKRADLRYLSVSALTGRVVAEHVERIRAGVEAGRAGFDPSFVDVGLADLELELAASQVAVETFVALDGFFLRDGFGHFRFLVGVAHASHQTSSPTVAGSVTKNAASSQVAR